MAVKVVTLLTRIGRPDLSGSDELARMYLMSFYTDAWILANS